MGEATFTKPIMKWLEKIRAKRAAKSGASAEEDELADLRDIFNLKAPTQTATSPPPAQAEAAPEEVGPPEQNLVQDIFGAQETGASEPQAREMSRTALDPPKGGDAADEPKEPAPKVRRVRRARAESPEEGTAAEGADAAVPPPATRVRRVSAAAATSEDISQPTATPIPQSSAVRRIGVAPARAGDAEEPVGSARHNAAPLQESGDEPTTNADASTAPGPASARPQPEPQPRVQPEPGPVEDSLSVTLKDVFKKKVVTNPHVRALLQRHGTVGARDLADELNDFARSVGATRENK